MQEKIAEAEKDICGIVMPISSIDGCDENHWSDVLNIISDSINSIGMAANLVSNADDVGVIHKRIIQNLYNNPIVVCDVSCKNPNVMFELGMRLAFDKPTIIIKDDKTSYSFDTSSIEHIEYPRDLRFNRINDFKAKLAAKIRSTLELHRKSPEQTTFLKHFGEFTVAKIETKEVSSLEFIMEELRSIRGSVRRLETDNIFKHQDHNHGTVRRIRIKTNEDTLNNKNFEKIGKNLIDKEGVLIRPFFKGDGSYIEFILPENSDITESTIFNLMQPFIRSD